MAKLYISDMHFFHDNLNHRMDCRGFKNAEELNAHMIRQWNSRVTDKDEVFLLGDFSAGYCIGTTHVLEKLNGKLHLILGNHDGFLEDKRFDRSRFVWIKEYAEIRDNKRKVILCHYPVFCYNGQYRRNAEEVFYTYMLYGHVHNTREWQLMYLPNAYMFTLLSSYASDFFANVARISPGYNMQFIGILRLFQGIQPLFLYFLKKASPPQYTTCGGYSTGAAGSSAKRLSSRPTVACPVFCMMVTL